MDVIPPDLMWLWLPLALAGSLISAQNVELNRRFKQEGFRLNLWRTFFASCIWLPMALAQGNWPHDGMFYAAAMFSGVGMIIGFRVQTDLAARHNGRVAVLHMPLKAVGVFVIWAIIDPVARAHVLEKPLITLGVLVCLGVMVASLATFRRNDVSWNAFKAIIPVVILYSIGDIFARLSLPSGLLQERLVVFLAVMTTTSMLVTALLIPWRPKPDLPLVSKPLLQAGLWLAVGNVVNQACFFIALSLGPNPAYVSMVGLLAPVWLLVYHRIVNLKDDANPFAGTVMVVAAIVLMLLVA